MGMGPPVPSPDEQDRQNEEWEAQDNRGAPVLLYHEQPQVPHANPPNDEDHSPKSLVLPRQRIADKEQEKEESDHGGLGAGRTVRAGGDECDIQEAVDRGQDEKES